MLRLLPLARAAAPQPLPLAHAAALRLPPLERAAASRPLPLACAVGLRPLPLARAAVAGSLGSLNRHAELPAGHHLRRCSYQKNVPARLHIHPVAVVDAVPDGLDF
jgi:hypothetical protein